MTVGERIKEIREKLGLSQVEFADKINVSKQTLYKYENNLITNIPSDKIEAVAEIGHISPSYIMGWDSNYQPTTVAAHLNTEDLTQAELDDVANYIEFIKAKRAK